MKYSGFTAALIATIFLILITPPVYAASDDPYEMLGSTPTYRISEVTEDVGYGYSRETPVNVGYGVKGERYYLSQLRGPNGQKVTYNRIGSSGEIKSKNPNAPMGVAVLDSYEVSYEGIETPIRLYINMYDYDGVPPAPAGFTFGEPLQSSLPTSALGSLTVNTVIDPEVQAIRIKFSQYSRKGTFEAKYKPLLDKLNLFPEKRDAFIDAIINEPAIINSDKKMAVILGEENLDEYLAYKERLQERTFLSELEPSLKTADQLTEKQRDALIDTMYEERIKSENNAEQGKTTSSITNKSLARMDRIYEAYAKAVGSTLSASQAEQFIEYVNAQRSALDDMSKQTESLLRYSHMQLIMQAWKYGDLFDKLDLSPDKTDELKELLLEPRMNASMNRNSGNAATPGKEQTEEHKERIAELLGMDNYAIYLGYEERAHERSIIKSFLYSLRTANKLTESQKESLTDAMYEARIKTEKESCRPDPDTGLTDSGSESANEDRLYEAYAVSADAILSASQTGFFKIYLSDYREYMSYITDFAARQRAKATQTGIVDSGS